MDDRKFRYDFFGEGLSQDTTDEERPKNNVFETTEILNLPIARSKKNNSTSSVEDSLMEFITEYFNGEVTEEFSTSEYFRPATVESSVSFGSSSNMSFDSVTSADTSKGNLDISDTSRESRKSISYEIRFINSTEGDGKVKLQIVPNRQPTSAASYLPQTSLEGTSDSRDHQEKLWLRQRVRDLERQLQCVEGESERVIGELKRIVERKNEIISHLELQAAGIKFMNSAD